MSAQGTRVPELQRGQRDAIPAGQTIEQPGPVLVATGTERQLLPLFCGCLGNIQGGGDTEPAGGAEEHQRAVQTVGDVLSGH